MREWFAAHYDVLKDFAAPAVASVAFFITTILAIAGLRTFDRWKREKVEERRIETAIDALALAYESKIVFRSIRSPHSNQLEHKNMDVKEGESDEERQQRGAYWAVGKRVLENRDYFERVWKLQPMVMAIFGEQMEDIFQKLHEARSLVQVASQALTWDLPLNPSIRSKEDYEFRVQLRQDLWGGTSEDRVETCLEAFRKGIERVCKPFVDREFSDGFIGAP
jgi:hypothetical protein